MESNPTHPVLAYLAVPGNRVTRLYCDGKRTIGYYGDWIEIEGATPGQTYSGDELEAVWQWKNKFGVWLDREYPVKHSFAEERLHRLRVKNQDNPLSGDKFSDFDDKMELPREDLSLSKRQTSEIKYYLQRRARDYGGISYEQIDQFIDDFNTDYKP